MPKWIPVLLLLPPVLAAAQDDLFAPGLPAEGLFDEGLFAAAELEAAPPALLRDDPEALWLLGAAELARDLPAEGTAHLEALILQRPNQRHLERSLFLLGEGYAAQGLHHRAAERFGSAARIASKPMTRRYAIFNLGESLYDAGDYARALEAYRTVEREFDEVWWGLYFATAQAEVQLGDNAAAVESLRRAREVCPGPQLGGQVDYWLGRVLAAEGRYAEAAAAYDAAVVVGPHPFHARAELEGGLTAYLRGDYAGAVERLSRAARSEVLEDAAVAEARYYLGRSYFAQEDYAAGEALAAGLLDDEDWSTAARWLLAESALRGGDYAVGAEQFAVLAAGYGEGARLARFKLGLCLFRQGALLDAEEAFAAVAGPTGDDTAGYWLALTVLRRGEPQRAAGLFRPVYDGGGPLADNALLELADLAAAAGRTTEAVELYGRLMAEFPASELRPLALFSRGRSYVRLGRHQLGQNDYAALVAAYPADELADDALYLIAQAAFETGRHQEARPVYRRIVEDYPASRYRDYARLRLADCRYELGEYSEARRLYQETAADTRLSEVADDAAYGAELAAWRLGEYPDVVAATRSYLEQRPDSYLAPELLLYLARERGRAGDLEGAVAYYRRIINDYPEAPELAAASSELAEAYSRGGDPAEALELLRRALAETPAGPGRAGLHFRLARAARETGDYDLALRHYNAVILEYPGSVDWLGANYEAAELYHELQETAAARAALQRVLAAVDDGAFYYRARLLAGFVEQQAGYESRALEHHAAAANADDPGVAVQALFWLGELNYGIGRLDEALARFQELVDSYGEAYPSYAARSILRRGLIFERRDQPQAARRQYRKVLDGDYAQSYQDRAAQRLAGLE
ncbi:MAG: tetratricopeptide repeat protein [Candidatus Coatesbacteria bacterium]|nr:tetratricopeptide repeat protein [Candidatus Coatesbacteria bacterium]